MTDPVLSPTVFKWVLTVLTMLGVFWVGLDFRYIYKLRGADMTIPENRDKRFAYVIGMAIAVCVTIGVLKYHGVV
ncbi:MAG TPA: hypothetical protein VGM90_20850 [Kofleriaceae bacterium]|jgi:hypothetical protein